MDQELEAATARIARRERLAKKAYNKAIEHRNNFNLASKKVRKTRKALRAAKLQLETIKRRGHIEEIFWRFPHIGTQILEELDILSLGRCREVNSWWKEIIDSDKIIVIRKIQYYICMPNELMKKKLQKNTLKFLKGLAIFVKSVSSSKEIEYGRSTWPKSSLHFFFFITQFPNDGMGMYLWKMIYDNIDNKNPLLTGSEGCFDGKTALYIAAKHGNLEICQCIMEHVKDLKPESNGDTVFHAAISSRNHNLCQYFIEKGVDLNMTNDIGMSPLDYAKEFGQADTVELIEASLNKA